jgi:RNA polymerase sigma-70 factor (ECF subfamily)
MQLTARTGIDEAEAAREAGNRLRLLEDLMVAHQKRVFRVALRMLGDIDEAADATQDCFLRVHRSITSCPADETAHARWLLRIVSNLCLDRLRSRKWQWWKQRLGIERASSSQVSAIAGPDRELLSREMAIRLSAAMVRLSPRQRAVFVLRHYEGLALEEIASQLSLNVGTVKGHLARAIENLREELKDFYGKQSPER